MVLPCKKQYFLSVVLLVLFGSVFFLLVSPAQAAEEIVSSGDTAAQSSLPNRAPAGYQVPARPVVTLPFTNISADRLRLGNVREVSGEDRPVLVTFANYPGTPQGRRSPDGQWALFYERGVLSVIRTDSSGEKHTLFKDLSGGGGKEYIPTVGLYNVFWSWDSGRVFYQFRKRYPTDSKTFNYEERIESVDIGTGETARHTDIGYYANLHSYATARYPSDPVLFDDSPDYQLNGPRGIKTRDGSDKWVIDGFHPLSLSPNKQMVLGYEQGYKTSGERLGVRRYLVYAVDGAGPLYSFDSEVPTGQYLWSPDNSKFVHHHGEHDGHTGELITSELYVMNLDGTGRSQLTDTPEVHERPQGWTADGQIVFTIEDRWYIANLVTK